MRRPATWFGLARVFRELPAIGFYGYPGNTSDRGRYDGLARPAARYASGSACGCAYLPGRVVVLGQDPYPAIAQATGRAFEVGNWKAGDRPQDMARSLKSLILAAWATRHAHARMIRRGGWSDLVRIPGEFAQADASIARIYGGTGLGMTIVKRTVERLDGTITVDSRLSDGAKFTVLLPLQVAKSSSKAA